MLSLQLPRLYVHLKPGLPGRIPLLAKKEIPALLRSRILATPSIGSYGHGSETCPCMTERCEVSAVACLVFRCRPTPCLQWIRWAICISTSSWLRQPLGTCDQARSRWFTSTSVCKDEAEHEHLRVRLSCDTSKRMQTHFLCSRKRLCRW